MKDQTENRTTLINGITAAYFVIAMTEIMAELFSYKPVIVVVKPLMPILLMVLYWFSSDTKNPLFFLAISFSVITNILFIPNDQRMLFFGIIAFMIHRIVILYYIFKLVKITDYIPVAIATIPFLLVFFYLLASSEVPENSFLLLVIQNILIAIFGGIALSNYIMHDNKKNSWLLICGLLFVALQFIVFIEKYYLSGLSPAIFRPIAMGLNAFAFYTFYEFVSAIEKSDDNGSSL